MSVEEQILKIDQEIRRFEDWRDKHGMDCPDLDVIAEEGIESLIRKRQVILGTLLDTQTSSEPGATSHSGTAASAEPIEYNYVGPVCSGCGNEEPCQTLGCEVCDRYPIDIHPELRERMGQSLRNRDVYKVYEEFNAWWVRHDSYHPQGYSNTQIVPHPTRLERVRWGLEGDPYLKTHCHDRRGSYQGGRRTLHSDGIYRDGCIIDVSRPTIQEARDLTKSKPTVYLDDMSGDDVAGYV